MFQPTPASAKIILPCAGFGRRVGFPNSKEMLPHPRTGKPMMQTLLGQLSNLNLPIHIILRREKTELLHFLQTGAPEMEVKLTLQLTEPTEEWPQTLLQTQEHWAEKNLVILPDSEWVPFAAASQLLNDLQWAEAAYGVFEASDSENWGHIQANGNSWMIWEKPQNLDPRAGYHTWGLFAFRPTIGKNILEAHCQSQKSHEPVAGDGKILLRSLESFTDFTRSQRHTT